MSADELPAYQHTQHAPLCLLLYVVAGIQLGLCLGLWDQPAMRWLFLATGLLVLLLAGAFHYLRVVDVGEGLRIAFGPIPLFRRTVLYDDILDIEVGRTTWIEGWGIHLSPRGGWVWNLWGFDCVELRLKKGVLRVGTNDAENLAEFLAQRVQKLQLR